MISECECVCSWIPITDRSQLVPLSAGGSNLEVGREPSYLLPFLLSWHLRWRGVELRGTRLSLLWRALLLFSCFWDYFLWPFPRSPTRSSLSNGLYFLQCSSGAFVLAAFWSSSRPLWSWWSNRLLLLFAWSTPAPALRLRGRLGSARLRRRLFGPTVAHACVCPPASKRVGIKAWYSGLNGLKRSRSKYEEL